MMMRYLTSGESHGKALVGILEGIPSGLPLTFEMIQSQLRRRKMGFGRGARQQIETDQVEILSGVRHGLTLGSPISLLIWNQDWKNWENIMSVETSLEGAGDSATNLGSPANSHRNREVKIPRPGHADLVGGIKYGHSDMRNVLERASARETAIRVGIASVARRLLTEIGIEISSRVVAIGEVRDTQELEISAEEMTQRADASSVRVLNPEAENKMRAAIERAKTSGETLGGEFEVIATGIPTGLGSYVQWDRRLEAEIGRSFLSLNATKGVQIGLGFEASRLPGSQAHDEIFPGDRPGSVRFETNRAGGIEGGMSTGQTLRVRAAMKPLATLMEPLRSVHLESGQACLAHVERSDVCAVPSAAVIGESLLALVLAEAVLHKFGGDSLVELRSRVKDWNERTPIQN